MGVAIFFWAKKISWILLIHLWARIFSPLLMPTLYEEVEIMTIITTENTVNFLKQKYACYTVPKLIVSDKGVHFWSNELELFAKSNGIH